MLIICIVWIAEKIKHFEKEREMLDLRADHSNSREGKQGWGLYHKQPTTTEPHVDLHIEWVYIVDLDNSYLTVRGGSG